MEAAMVDNYKEKYEQLLAENSKKEQEFGQKRAQFRQLYLDCEALLKSEKALTSQLELQVTNLAKQINDLKSENEGIRAAAQLSEESKEEEFVALKVKHQEEIASLQHIWQEASKEGQTRIAKEFEEERKKLVDANARLEQRIRNGMRTSEDGKGNNEGIMSMMSNAFSKKTSTSSIQKVKGIEGPAANLEGSQQQVQDDVNAWKSIVGPLEQEIEELKKQLEEADSKLKAPDKTVDQASDEKIKETQKYLDAERSARTDLEMYVAVLNTQKGVLQEDADKLRRELHNVCRLFEQEKMSHSELKQTWKLANEQFLEQQNNLAFENEKMKTFLTHQQLEQLSRDIRVERSTILTTSNPSKNQQEIMQQVATPTEKSDLIAFDSIRGETVRKPDKLVEATKKRTPNAKRKQEQKKISPTKNVSKQGTIADSVFNSLFPSAYHAKNFDRMFKEDFNVNEKPLMLSSSSDSEDDDLEQAILQQNIKRYGIEQAEEVEETSSLKPTTPNETVAITKSSSSDNILNTTAQFSLQDKSLSQGDVSWNSTATKEKSYNDEVDSKLSLNETGWSTVSDNYGHACMMCQNYEKQLQRLQKEFMCVKEKEESLGHKVNTIQSELDSEKDKFASLERSIESAAGDTKSQINIYTTNQKEVDKQVELLHQQFAQFQTDILAEMKILSEERDGTLAKFTSLEDESEDLKSTLDGEDVRTLKAQFEEMKLSSSANEEKLKGEILFLKDRVMAEQFDRENTESVLQQDLNQARDELMKLKHQLEKQKTHSNEDLMS
ncbi:rab GTPase-binding effector protein 1-like isoform X4 [Hydractinia symbiolongicarpus]|uniref:rab GTPase-binding effector protein 1-like isoform X4 n=1 Tax=Hydractinia symbiolongicarpus TaxID=13093 RepID=UPI00254DC91D|nr:rab GTPase-binding effector protein 1-like isoform X4 [Hydractinia symbiolongicarpus]